jgi:hypothetical protein
VIGQRAQKLTPRQEKDAYRIATERDRGQCQRCGRFGPVERDHRQGRDAYNTVPSNLQCVCHTCHQWITEHPREAMEQGFTVSRWADPASTPAWRFGVGWVIYDNDGGWTRTVAPH